jgi:hypothetical protein
MDAQYRESNKKNGCNMLSIYVHCDGGGERRVEGFGGET